MLHQTVDLRSLELHKAIAQKLRGQPSLLQTARNNVSRWLARDSSSPYDPVSEWNEILTRWSFDDILALLESEDEEAARLRQSSPFPGVLNESERLAILRKYEPFRI
ncbi:MAG: hypothetical protein PHD76_11515 [Methylacidiphilales bacterium]|nr:hypothetical protein [Candidatus Methylacidiphilales bacterium]